MPSSIAGDKLLWKNPKKKGTKNNSLIQSNEIVIATLVEFNLTNSHTLEFGKIVKLPAHVHYIICNNLKINSIYPTVILHAFSSYIMREDVIVVSARTWSLLSMG